MLVAVPAVGIVFEETFDELPDFSQTDSDEPDNRSRKEQEKSSDDDPYDRCCDSAHFCSLPNRH
jgi:hypothetical protein